MCPDTRFTGICDAALDSTGRDQENLHRKKLICRLLKDLALTDLPMPYQQPVLYFGTRPAVVLFFPAAADLLCV